MPLLQRIGRRSPILPVVLALAVSALSLLGPRALAFDPAAWLIWGEQLARMQLDTVAGPSWKPLPVLFTTPLSLAGGAGADLWLLVARAGAVLAVFGVAALGSRLGGRAAALGAAAIVLLSPWWWYNAALGNSEGLLAAAVTWAAVAHLAGRRGLALAGGLVAATIRPEVVPFFLLYCAVLVRDKEHRRMAAAGGLVAVSAWIGPDLLGGGGALHAAETARGWASPASAQNADVPVLAVLVNAVRELSWPAAIAAVAAVGLVRRSGLRRPEVVLCGLAVAYVALVAALTAAGYAGNPRYAVPAIALATPVAALGAVRLGRRLAPGRGPVATGLVAAATAALVVAVSAVNAAPLWAAAQDVSARATWSAGLDEAIRAAGGASALRHCPVVRTAGPWRALVAYRLEVPMREVTSAPHGRSMVLLPPVPPAPRPAHPDRRLLARVGGWEVWDACGGGTAPTAPGTLARARG